MQNSSEYFEGHYPKLERFLEIFPALITWTTLILPFALAPYFPDWVAVFMLSYYVWWTFRSAKNLYFMVCAYRKFTWTMRQNWSPKLAKLLKRTREDYPNQVVLIATYKEPTELVAETIQTWAKQDYPMEKVMFVLAVEEREGEKGIEKMHALEKQFKDKFGSWVSAIHPTDLPNEIKGRGSNATWAIKQAEKILAQKNWDPQKTLVTSVDADSQADPNFLAYMTHEHLRTPDRQYKSLQPLPFYLNNLWTVPCFARLLASSSTLFHLSNSVNQGHVKNFSAFTYTLWQLRRIDYYPVDTPVEDYRTFYRSYIRNFGNTDVVPLYLPISMDAVDEDSFWKTIKAQYIQFRRWASGASHLAWFVPRLLNNPRKYPFWKTLWEIWENLFIKSWTWATTPLLLFYGAWAPLLVNQNFGNTILGHNLPLVAGKIMTFMLLGIIISFVINTAIIAKINHPQKLFTIKHILEWILVPFMTIFFGAFPAIDAQTRLALGKIVSFEVTKKKR